MNAIGPATGDYPLDLLDEPGATLWWYVDLIDHAGNGAVCIWSWGLPFLPGVSGDARRGRPQPPRLRPSVNLVVYQDWRAEFYVLREFAPEECSWEPGRWSFGRTRFRRHDNGRRLQLEAELDFELSGPHVPVRGSIFVEGPRRSGLEGQRHPTHSWEPLTLGSATGQLELVAGDFRAKIDGRAYFDRNGGRAPLQQIGLDDWRWGRYALPRGEIVFTTVRGDGEDFIVLVDQEGRAERHLVHRATETRATWSCFGPRWPSLITLDTDVGQVQIHQQALVDDAPFYQRSLGRAVFRGESGPGIAERVRIERLDPAWMRPLVRMRVDAGPRSSIWLPLFSGPRQHRGLSTVLRGGRV